jgi:hypothetical protein
MHPQKKQKYVKTLAEIAENLVHPITGECAGSA